ncbi:MAG: lactate utilization protein C, partial [Hyphomicrobiaceae bacterium]
MSSREDILGRVRAKLGRTPTSAAAGRAAIEATLSARVQGPRPALPEDKSALTERFIEKSLAYSSTVDRVGTYAEAPAAVARYLASQGLPSKAVIWPALARLDWADAGLEIASRGAQESDLVGITGCFCAIAETGTLMLCGGVETPASVSLLPETHIALVATSRIVA